MNKFIGAAAMVAAVAFAVSANAGEIKGVVKSTTDRTVTIDTTNAGQPGAPAGINGNIMEFTIPGPAAGQTDMRAGIIPGMSVTFTYTTAGNVNTVTKVVK